MSMEDHAWMDFQIGDLVDYHSVIGGPVTSTGHKITHMEIEMKGRKVVKAVAWVSGKRGCVAMEALTPAVVG